MKNDNLQQIRSPYKEISRKTQIFLSSIMKIVHEAWDISKSGQLMVFIDEDGVIRKLTIKMKEPTKREELIALIQKLPHYCKQLQSLDLDVVGVSGISPFIGKIFNLKNLAMRDESLEIIDEKIFSSLRNLESLRLSGNFYQIPKTISFLSKLKILSLFDTPKLEDFSNLIGELSNLEELILINIPMKFIPSTLGNLSNLLEITIRNVAIDHIPESLGNLHHLEKLTLHDIGLKELPESFGHLQNLQKLTLHEVALEELPESIGDCYRLKELDIKDCNNLTTLPNSLGDLHNLESIHIYGCLNLKSIPDCIANLPRLKYVYLIENHKLDIPVWTQALLLKKLETFNVDGCKTKWMNP